MSEEKDYREAKRVLGELRQKIAEFHDSLNLTEVKERISRLEMETHNDEFWQNVERAKTITRDISRLKKMVEPWEQLKSEVDDALELMEIAQTENDIGVMDEVFEKVDEYGVRFDRLETLELLSDENDNNNAIISIHPGAGGTESQDWAEILFRMYLRWAEKHEYTINVIDYTPGDEAGIKSSTVLISGEFAFGLLKCERGIHRLVRISPFDSNKRRHTSFAAVDVIPEINEDIEIDIIDSDLRIDTYRASGAGGQHVNKTDSAVRITHLPTGVVVQCQNERSQHKNKAFAMKVLKSKLYELKLNELEEKKTEKSFDKKDISWGNQIRSYVFQPYTLVKDHRTGKEMGSIDYVLDGDIDGFIYAYLKSLKR